MEWEVEGRSGTRSIGDQEEEEEEEVREQDLVDQINR